MIKGGPKIIKDGLVLCLDAHDAKSYAGEPVTNLYGDMSTSSSLRGNRTEYNTGGTWPSDMPMCPEPVGRVYKHTSGALTSSWSGNSYGYMHKDISTTSGLMYTLTFWVYLSPDCDIDYMQSSIEGATSNYGSWTGYPQQYDFTKKGTWQLLSRHATADTSVRFLIYPGHTGVTDGSFSGFFAWGGMQVVQAEYVTPFVLSSRSATDGWVDRTTNNNDGTLTNMIGTGASHYRDGQVIMPVSASYLDFDATDDRVAIGSIGSMTAFTVELWINPDAVQDYQNPIDCNYSYNGTTGNIGPRLELRTGASPNWIISGDTGNNNNYYYIVARSGAPSAGTWYHAALTYDGSGNASGLKSYWDGSLVTSGATNVNTPSAVWVNTMNNVQLGLGFHLGSSRHFNGQISTTKIYNKALTAAQILSNYNATKGRFL